MNASMTSIAAFCTCDPFLELADPFAQPHIAYAVVFE